MIIVAVKFKLFEPKILTVDVGEDVRNSLQASWRDSVVFQKQSETWCSLRVSQVKQGRMQFGWLLGAQPTSGWMFCDVWL